MDPDTATGVRLDVGGRLPALTRANGTPVWRPQYTRDSVILAVLHGAECEPCTRFRHDLARAQPDFRAWDGKLVIAVTGELEGRAGAAEPAVAKAETSRGTGPGAAEPAVVNVEKARGTELPLTEPAVARVPDRVGEPPAVVIADRFGHIYHVEAGGPAHALSEPRQLEEWLRFIGTQCPE
jgi:hypothetical protein